MSKSGRVIRTIRLPIKVGELSFSPDLKEFVVVSPHDDTAGGKMYLYTLASKQLQRVPLRAVVPESAKLEVYSEPQFSADGRELFFNTHPQAEGDLAETNGPIAELDLKSLRARTIASTIGLLTDGFLLSPNGRDFLLWDEEKVIDTNGATTFDLHDFQLEEPFKWALDVAWIGNSCVLYQAGKSQDSRVKSDLSYFVLNLRTLKSDNAIEILGITDEQFKGLVSYKFPNAAIQSATASAGDRESGIFLISKNGKRQKVGPKSATNIQVFADDLKGDFPAECR
jgi:WD40 repeat protein